jgi:hypothetical protein
VNETRRVEKLRADHPIESFDCGKEELNRYLLRFAWQNQQAGAAQTYIGFAGDAVIGYYTLAVGSCHPGGSARVSDQGAGTSSRADHVACTPGGGSPLTGPGRW